MEQRQRLAWIVLVLSFAACVGLAAAVPIGGGAYVQNSRRPLSVTVQANQGTVGVRYGDGETSALFAGQQSQALDPTGEVLTNVTDTALVLFETPNAQQLLARLQVYGNTSVTIDEASSPRFEASSLGHSLALTLNSGRMLITIPDSLARAFNLTIDLPQGELVLTSPGQYSVITSNAESQLSVIRGTARLVSPTSDLSLVTDQRGALTADGGLVGPLRTERNLIANSDFSRDFSEWVILAQYVEVEGQPSTEMTIVEERGATMLTFARMGIGHADAGVRQIIDADVADYESLRLTLSMRIMDQSLSVCGEAGSECPLIVRIEYEDTNGVGQVWQQGFYAIGAVAESTPDVCLTCPAPLLEHQQVPFQQLTFYESENLVDRLGQLAIGPRRIKAITLSASGHSYRTEVVGLALLAQEHTGNGPELSDALSPAPVP
jgi:hypothetical protein